MGNLDVLQGIVTRELEKLNKASLLEGLLAEEHMAALFTIAKIIRGAPDLADGQEADPVEGLSADEALKALGSGT